MSLYKDLAIRLDRPRPQKTTFITHAAELYRGFDGMREDVDWLVRWGHIKVTHEAIKHSIFNEVVLLEVPSSCLPLDLNERYDLAQQYLAEIAALLFGDKDGNAGSSEALACAYCIALQMIDRVTAIPTGNSPMSLTQALMDKADLERRMSLVVSKPFANTDSALYSMMVGESVHHALDPEGTERDGDAILY